MMSNKLARLEMLYRYIVDGVMGYEEANAIWEARYPNDPQPMFGPQADMRRKPAVKASVCECGSGSNQRGAGHSHWCPLWEVYRD